MVLNPWRIATTIMLAGGLIILIWSIAMALETDEIEIDPTDPFGNDVAQFRREIHDWDRNGDS